MADQRVTIAELAAKLLTMIEGKKLFVYADSRGIPTAGIGHTGTDVPPLGTPVSPEQVQSWFEQDQAPLLELVKDKPVLEGAALVSFGFNCGIGALGRVMAGAANLGEFIYAGKQPILKPRRELEAALIQLSREMTNG